jgi:glucosamine--fructose-6-phosphate aminotransferase (isomerizing)
VLAISRSGESSETVRAARVSRENGLFVTGFTCTEGSALTQNADQVVFAETHPEEDIVMTSSASLLLLMGLRFAGLTIPGTIADAAEAVLDNFDTNLGTALEGRDHFVFLGGGPLYGIAREGALKLQEMSLSHTEAHHPLEYRHGPISLIDEASFVVLLYHPDTADEEALLAAELQSLGAFVVGFGGPGTLTIDLPADALTRGLVVLPALQILGERVAQARGLDSTTPRHLSKVVLTP